jgi:hypothetical protein
MIVYMPYYIEINPSVVRIRTLVFLFSNIILYSCYVIGFLWGKED